MLNPLSSDLGAMRQSLVPRPRSRGAQQQAQATRPALVRIWSDYTQRDVTDEDGTVRKAYDEKEHLSLWVTGGQTRNLERAQRQGW